MSAKPRKRRRRRTLAGRARTYWIPLLLALAVFGYGGWALASAPFFRMQSLAVSGLTHDLRSTIVGRAAIDPHANVWLMDRGAIAKRLDALPYVKDVRIHVRPPAAVWLDVVERTADACVRDVGNVVVTVDDASRVLERGCADPSLVLFRVAGRIDATPATFLRDPELARLRDDAREIAATGDRYRSFAHDTYGDLEATLSDGIAVRFGDDDDLRTKQRIIGPLLAQIGPRLTNVRTVDLRAPATPVVEFRK